MEKKERKKKGGKEGGRGREEGKGRGGWREREEREKEREGARKEGRKEGRERGRKVGSVTQSEVRLLAAQKPIKRQGWWKGKFALFLNLDASSGGGGADVGLPSKGQPPPPSQWARAFIDRHGGSTQKQHSQP